MPKFQIEVAFKASPVTIEVEAPSYEVAWQQRHELAAAAEPQEWELRPYSVEPVDGQNGDSA